MWANRGPIGQRTGFQRTGFQRTGNPSMNSLLDLEFIVGHPIFIVGHPIFIDESWIH